MKKLLLVVVGIVIVVALLGIYLFNAGSLETRPMDKFGLSLDNAGSYASQGMTGAAWWDGHYDPESATMSGFVQLEAGHNHTVRVALMRDTGVTFWEASGHFYAPKDTSGIYIVHIDWTTKQILGVTHSAG